MELSLKQAAYAQEELGKRSIPLLRPPLKLLKGDAHHLSLPTAEPPKCQMHSCFDYSHCSLASLFPVYFYPANSVQDPNVNASVAQVLDTNFHITSDPSVACVYVVILDGRLPLVCKRKFDLVVPPATLTKEPHHVWEFAPVIIPARRRYLLSFHGRPAYGTNLTAGIRASEVVNALMKMAEGFENGFNFNFSCWNTEHAVAMPNEWLLCEDNSTRAQLLRQSTFSIVLAPLGDFVSSHVFLTRLCESLQNGAIPVIVGGDAVELPFAEFVDWSRVALLLPVARVTELHFILRTYLDVDIAELRRRGRLLWENYLGTTSRVINTVLSLIRTRLGIPAPPAPEEPSPSVFNSSFRPLMVEAGLDTENKEMLGPMEPRFASMPYQRNFSLTFNGQAKVWNEDFDPHTMYPFGVQDPLLPSEAKFMAAARVTVPEQSYRCVEQFKATISNLHWPVIGVPIEVVRPKKNSLNNRFLPFSAIETEAVLSMDDDVHLRHDEIVFGFRVWREARDRIVGFPGRYHAWDTESKSWHYSWSLSCELSMVLTGAAFLHKHYFYLYSYAMPQAIRDRVDEYMNCEDIAMNFLVSHITRKPPLKVTSRHKFECPKCTASLSYDNSHCEKRHKCLNFFVRVYGYTPLLYTQFRLDSVLFKTSIPDDKQRCFKFV
ncbi:hypothetical protein HPB48_004008 [Haemaphysalis longicornis]|uniref:Exostosin-3 n=1 Tax=Haemaphysalis longicornis TaxID=44386 RepID=A0A9J6FWD3_HAELO|nr:hypothetical protein HPB48_004008 [Haemaphysalis longicornis]